MIAGVALLVAILGSPATQEELVVAHERGWLMISILSLATAVIGLAQPAVGRRTSIRTATPVPPAGVPG